MTAQAEGQDTSLPLIGGGLKDADGKPSPPSRADLRRTVIISLSVCAFYVTVSASMVFVNKALTYSFGFRSTNTILFLQMIFTIVLLRALRAARVVDFADFERGKAIAVAPVSVFYSLNAAVALLALRELSVPSYTLIKRLAPLFTLGLEYLLLGKKTTTAIAASLVFMVSGTVVAANADASSALSAWGLGLASCFFQAMYLTYVKRSGVDTGMSSVGILYYHSILSLPCILAIILAVGEIGEVLAYPGWLSIPFICVLCLSLTMGLLLNYALFLCTELTSPTSTVVSGQVKAMIQTVVGMFTFGGVEMNGRYIFGTLLNIFGGLGYAASKFQSLRNTGTS